MRDAAAEQRSLTQVQRWIMSVLAVTTILHLVFGIIFAAYFLDTDRPGAQVGMCVIAGGFGVLAVAVALMIHGRKPLSPWLLLGVLPAILGIWLIKG